MEDEKMLEYAKAIKSDLHYAFINDEDYVPKSRDLQTIEWLVEQAKRAEMYKSALLAIGENKVSPTYYAISALIEAEQRFKKTDEIMAE